MAFSKILVPQDSSLLAEQAIPFAQALASDDGTLIYLMVVPQADAIYGLTGSTVASSAEVGAMFQENASTDLRDLASRWVAVAPHYEIAIATGDPTDQILKTAEERGAELIVIASHGRGALGRWTFGSVADRISRTSSIPVMIVRPQDGDNAHRTVPEIDRVILPTDGSKLSEAATKQALAIAKRINRPLVLLRAIFPEAELAPTTGYSAVYAPDIYNELAESLEKDAQATLETLAASLRDQGAEIITELRDGPAAQTIQEFATPKDLIVMTSHGRSGFRRWLIGSVAEKLVRTAPCPVVLVRAENEADS